MSAFSVCWGIDTPRTPWFCIYWGCSVKYFAFKILSEVSSCGTAPILLFLHFDNTPRFASKSKFVSLLRRHVLTRSATVFSTAGIISRRRHLASLRQITAPAVCKLSLLINFLEKISAVPVSTRHVSRATLVCHLSIACSGINSRHLFAIYIGWGGNGLATFPLLSAGGIGFEYYRLYQVLTSTTRFARVQNGKKFSMVILGSMVSH